MPIFKRLKSIIASGFALATTPEAQAWSSEAVKKRGQARDRANRELYALNTSASGVAVSGAVAGAVPSTMPVSADDALRADRFVQPDKYDSESQDSAYSDTRPSSFNGFATTQPFAPLMTDIIEHPKA